MPLHDMRNRLLDETVEDRWNTPFALPSVRFRNQDPYDRAGAAPPFGQFGPDARPMDREIAGQLLDAHVVDAWRISITLDLSECPYQIPPLQYLRHER